MNDTRKADTRQRDLARLRELATEAARLKALGPKIRATLHLTDRQAEISSEIAAIRNRLTCDRAAQTHKAIRATFATR